ncbi:response regulator transcription factor [bacterium]|nr:response regulator transcription factor [bacterium]
MSIKKDEKKESKKKILLVEDEAHLAFNLQFNMQAEGYDVVPAVNGLIAIEKYESEGPFAAIVLDVNLPELNGFQVLEKIRAKDSHTGIIMLTARASDSDRLTGLRGGADDYLTKPFNLEELMVRLSRMIKRSDLIGTPSNFEDKEVEVMFGHFKMHKQNLTLKSPADLKELTALEVDIICEFIKNEGKVLSREHLLNKVWGVAGDIETRTVDNFIVRIRKLIEENPSKPKHLISVRGRGYKFTSDVSE